MLLAIDIGNTTIKLVVFDRENLIRKFTAPTVRHQTAPEIDSLVSANLPQTISSVIVSSVVPELKHSIEKFIKNRFGIAAFFVEHDFDFGLHSLRFRNGDDD
jgi:pantothenate kinase type III